MMLAVSNGMDNKTDKKITVIKEKKKGGWRNKLEVWDKHIPTTIYEIDKLCYNTGDFTQYSVMT